MDRVDKINYYLDIAETILERGTCIMVQDLNYADLFIVK